MSTTKVILVTVLAGGISIGAAIYGQRWLGDARHATTTAALVGDRADSLPDFRLPDLEGREIASAEWAGKVLVINYWASWCPPCVREMPTLIRAQQAHDPGHFRVVGIAIDEQDAVEHFLVDHPVNYAILMGNPDAVEMSRRLGNRMQGVPFTVIFDRGGRRVFSQVGEVSAATLDAQLAPLLPAATSVGSAANGG
jgi:thiol-disulfide isomerase/thioredoxin